MTVVNPLSQMRLRDHDNPRHGFGKVRSGGRRVHQGWDLDAAPGTPTYAISDGVVEFVESKDSGDYGKQICIAFKHGARQLYAFYAHLQIPMVIKGQTVNAGLLIATTGRTGNAKRIPAKEAHLHFEIRTGPRPGKGLLGRIDPAEVLGYSIYSCR